MTTNTNTIPEFVSEEIRKAIRRGKTFEAMMDYLPNHIGETFTCADLRKLYPEISSHVLAQWLDKPWAIGYRVNVNHKAATIVLDKPVEVRDYYNDVCATITEYKVNSYTIEGAYQR